MMTLDESDAYALNAEKAMMAYLGMNKKEKKEKKEK